MNTKIRELRSLILGTPTIDGDGVKMTRLIGSPELNMLDPFLLFDAFESDQAQDYIGGFPDHPHRGFETVTYLLAGRMRHKDNAGHEGVLEAGGVQWMTAGKGIVHSEMPEQENGLLQGFQLWINLPASEKMQAPAYQEFSANEIAVDRLDNEIEIRVIAGATENGVTGPIINKHVTPTYMDVFLPENETFIQTISAKHNAFIFVVEGSLLIGDLKEEVGGRQMAILDEGNQVIVIAKKLTRFLLIAAQPLNETVARGGPFVMNTKEEIAQAFADYKNHRF
jgi:redox-sensitive bicupin YhaK (pirin superfamily)